MIIDLSELIDALKDNTAAHRENSELLRQALGTMGSKSSPSKPASEPEAPAVGSKKKTPAIVVKKTEPVAVPEPEPAVEVETPEEAPVEEAEPEATEAAGSEAPVETEPVDSDEEISVKDIEELREIYRQKSEKDPGMKEKSAKLRDEFGVRALTALKKAQLVEFRDKMNAL